MSQEAAAGEPVAVVGAGVVGLNAALALATAGHPVVVLAADEAARTVSAVAGGLWSPFRAGPAAAVARWARVGYDAYACLADAVPAAGVRLLDVVLVVEDDARPHPWEACAPRAGRPATPAERPPGVSASRVLRVPSVDTTRHLAWLQERLIEAGGRVERRRVRTLEEAFDAADVVVACPGLAARELLDDPTVFPLRGVVVEVAHPGTAALPALLDERGTQPTYVLPRPDGTVLLGGRADPGDERLDPTPEEVTDIVERCVALVPALQGARVLYARAGLRPGRPDVRVQSLAHPRGRLVVDYGHGGSGWTLAAGCAADVVALVHGA
ncbi:putative D-amino-acid oxidase [Paraconexibacter sp. AEG42_29]|uniref:D-amino-acid oxidase n=1 Tax=Paraconexibacter sp. AEG42_29 TaxID=2997339 RepID=A0AAU7AYN3_9ACTN